MLITLTAIKSSRLTVIVRAREKSLIECLLFFETNVRVTIGNNFVRGVYTGMPSI